MRGDIRGIGDWRWLLVCWVALGLCSAGHTPPHNGRHPAQRGPGAPGFRAPAGHDRRWHRVCAPIPEDCGPGYYRQRRGLYLSQCAPCRCNGLSDECEDGTGRCLNCGYNTAGDHCERCKDGYYGNAAQGTCHVCPCPFTSLSNSFAASCREHPEGFECVCKPGYAGLRCERCALGYYGNPMSFRGSCLPCNCDTGICDSRTGECINNVEPNDPDDGDQCQECDSCVQALLIDLEGMDDGLEWLKTQLKNISGGAVAQEALKKLEDTIAVTKALVEKYNSSVYSQVPKVRVLDADVSSFNEDMGQLREKADRAVQTAQEALDSTDETHQGAADLASETQNLLQNIQDLLEKLKGVNSSGSTEEVEKMLTEARRLVHQMELHNCTAHRKAAERERKESRKLLHYIKYNMTQPQASNQNVADRIAGLLKQYEAKLKDLEEALKEADRAVGRAADHNRRNAAALEDMLQRSKELEKERDMVAGQISMARDQLSNIADLLKMLEDIKMDYEGLAALLDGAKTKLIQKGNDISRAVLKEAIVVRAEKHAEELDRLARELQEVVRNASDIQDVRRAMDTIDAYRDIINAIAAAAEAAERAKEAADVALSDVKKEGLPDRAQDLRDQASTLLEKAKDAQAHLNIKEIFVILFTESSDEQKALRKRIDEAQKKENMLEEDLLKAWQKLNETRRDDIAKVLSEAKENVTSANDTVNDAMKRLSSLTEGLDKMNVTSLSSNFDSFLKDLNETVSNLTDTLTPLLNQTEELSSQVPATSSNVSESIRRIKELIEQARDTANRIPVPMDFAGDGHVEMRPPTDLEDLRAYTAMELTLQRPLTPGSGVNGRFRRQSSGDMFVLYLGNKNSSKDYIGMVLKSNVLRCIYNLGGAEREMTLGSITESSSETTIWDKVDFYRIYQEAKVAFTKAYNLKDPDATLYKTAQGDSARTLLDLDPKQVVFYVGGYPKDFQPPESLRYPMYKGCIEFYTFNDQFISLYNFQNAAGVNKQKPCKRPSPDKLFKYFEGTGYARVKINGDQSLYRFSQFVISQSENGMLLYIKGQDSHYSINVEKGHLVLRGREGDRVLEYKSSSKEFPLPEGKDVQVIFQGNIKKILVRVRGVEVISANYTVGTYKNYYIGGLPEFLRERDRIATPPFKGCMSNIKLDSSNVQFEEEIGIRPGCAKQLLTIRESAFHLGGSLSAAPGGFGLTGDVTVSLGFRSTESKGLLLKNSQGNNGIELSLDDGFVVFKFNNEAWRSNKMYKDGKWHYLTAVRNGSRIEMRVDEEDLGQAQALSSPVPANGQDILLGGGTFQGCLSNLYMRRPDNLYRPENLTAFNTSGDVLLGFCTAERPLQALTAGRYRDGDHRRAGKG
ncbi:laminin subunit alpha-3-like [Megalops cyprinoides]|uniref:laminin subunit alpha-3-like n=1 Tax=Megalops cyprinoides TaxID=118141 RepID=UPI0018642FD1|nr:laminin subunit alpha-3-like [Megalops cyprinoides]